MTGKTDTFALRLTGRQRLTGAMIFRSIGLASLGLLLLWCGHSRAAASPLQTPSASDPETQARKLIDQAIEALGGPAYLAVRDVTLTGRFYQIYHGSASASTIFVDYFKYPDRERQELGKKRDDIVIHNGDQGWDVDFRGVHPMTPDDVQGYRQSLELSIDHILRYEINSKKYRIYYEGSDMVEGINYDILTLEDAHREALHLLLNARTHLPEVLRYRIKDPKNGGVDHFESWWANFQRVEGVVFPFHRIRMRNGERIGETFVNDLKFNSGLSDSLFVPSKTK
ncbi:MAG: hypothetical protein PHX83_11655 [Acidobacteriia bacterium]|nr:hypothetical protein [Terriglobia bacterium]